MIATFNADAISVNKGLYFAQTNPTNDPFLLTHLFLEASSFITEASPYILNGFTNYLLIPLRATKKL